jgi:hypothetical protein
LIVDELEGLLVDPAANADPVRRLIVDGDDDLRGLGGDDEIGAGKPTIRRSGSRSPCPIERTPLPWPETQ